MKKQKIFDTKTICAVGLLIAFSVAIGWVCKTYFTFFGVIRVTFENLPIFLSSLLFGSVAGAITGVSADILSCITSSDPKLNPIVTVGAAAIGIIPSLIYRHVIKKNKKAAVWLSVFISHILGSMIIKSIGLHVLFSWGIEVLIWRIPLYLAISVCEAFALTAVLKNKYIEKQFL